ncbi:SURF1 family protein [Jannaschia sp. LMIT008]|uniref:SURF1 family protein n=1 Tax=Jannaschia maritima TaxID=3032585 RepID=UPI0028125A68|nr:SURF1 family protein [Jannaschia sp. LMIT008]
MGWLAVAAMPIAALVSLWAGARIACRLGPCDGPGPADGWVMVWAILTIWGIGKVALARVAGIAAPAVLAAIGFAAIPVLAAGVPAVQTAGVWAVMTTCTVLAIVGVARPAVADPTGVALYGFLGVVVLFGLGAWQLDRAAEKDAYIAAANARLGQEYGALPDVPDPSVDRFRPVAVDATVAGPAIPVFGTWRGYGAGTRLIVPLAVGQRRVLADLGAAAWTSGTSPAQAATLAPAPGTVLVVRGHLDWPDETGGPSEDGAWLQRDLAALAAAAGTEPVLLITAETVPPVTGVAPLPMGTEAIADNHVGYAVQWSGLGLVWAGMTAFALWRITRRAA